MRNGSLSRRWTIRLAICRAYRSSPYVLKIRVNAGSSYSASTRSAVNGCDTSILISNGASWLYENPRSVSSICRLDSPKSMNTASTRFTPTSSSTCENASNAACTGVNRSASPSERTRSVAIANASASRSMPIRRACGAALRNAMVCPASPSVQSTATAPSWSSAGATSSTQRSSSTG